MKFYHRRSKAIKAEWRAPAIHGFLKNRANMQSMNNDPRGVEPTLIIITMANFVPRADNSR
jgi:hypothetical protein